jgi:sister chromatid cohesion protein DCC1
MVLLEVTESQLKELLASNGELCIKGRKDENAVLCTLDATFALKVAETSNTMLLVPQPSNAETDSATVVSRCGSHLELARCAPRTFVLHDIMSSAYGRVFSLNELEDQVQASRAEILNALGDMQALAIDGTHFSMVHPTVRHRALDFVINSCIEHDWMFPLNEEQCRQIAAEMPASEAQVVLHYAKQLTAADATVFRAEQLLQTAMQWHGDDFEQTLRESLPQNHPSMSIDEIYAYGLILIDRALRTVQYFPKSALPRDISQRFRALFKAKEKWTAKEIEPFIKDVREIHLPGDAFLMKYSRANQKLTQDEEVTYSSWE